MGDLDETTGSEGTEATEGTTGATEGTTGVTEGTTGEGELSTKESVEKVVAEANKEGKVEGAAGNLPEEYVADLNFKVMDDEHKFPDFIHSFITDKEKENQMRDLLTKAAGLDRYKTSNEELTERNAGYERQIDGYQPALQQYKQLSEIAIEARNTGDYGQFFAAAQMNPQQIIQWASNVVAQQQKNPQYLQQQNQQHQASFQSQQYQNQAQTMEQQNQNLQQQMYQQQVNFEVMNPANADFIKDFDSRAGSPGSFQKEVVQYGAMIEATTGKTLPPSQIVSELKTRYQGFLTPSAQQVQAQTSLSQEAGQPSETVQSQSGKPVIPHIKGKSHSPVKKQISSTDDLRRLRKANAQ